MPLKGTPNIMLYCGTLRKRSKYEKGQKRFLIIESVVILINIILKGESFYSKRKRKGPKL
jgi:hypothetical protein